MNLISPLCKKLALLIFCFLVEIPCNAQQKNNPKRYFEYINKAELAICDSNYNVAVQNYKIAFQYLDEPFGKDLYNLLRCGAITSDMESIDKCIPKFKERNYILPEFINNYSGTIIGEYTKKLYNNNSIASKIDVKYRSFIGILMDSDQAIRYELEEKKLPQQEYDSIVAITDSINMAKLLHYIDSTGVFPTESVVGNNYNSALSSLPYEILLIHYAASAGMGHFYNKPIDLHLNNRVLSGEFPPDLYAHLCDSRGYGLDGNKTPQSYLPNYLITSKSTDNPSFDFLDRSTWQIKLEINKLSPEEEKVIDERRKKMNMESCQDFLKKVRYLVPLGDDALFQLMNGWLLGVLVD